MRSVAVRTVLGALVVGLGLAGAVNAGEILVTQDIAVSTVWTANNTYNLQKQIYVLPGATLTIQAGTVIASDTNGGGSLAVTQGAQIFVQGTPENPVIMTSKADVATWRNGDPKTGTWRESATEWGNLTLMGKGYISENATVGNTPVPSASNFAVMEGLVPTSPQDPNVRYGGGDDDDDSGSISYLSIRYGGKVVALTVELNGLSLGGIGRATDIDHVEIMNNVDDGIEIWGGAVNLKYISIWNIGDDSFDIDQGWRGKAQFVLVVQGHSLDADQGSGVGDNCFETDGAEDSNWQPVTTTSIYNCTVIGHPVDGDGLTAWRDNARVQYHNCIFMDCGEKVVRFDDKDGDGANGYGFNGTLSWPATWTTDYSVYSTVNAPANPAAFYKSQTSGKLAEMTDSVFFNNTNSAAYTEADARGVFATANNNVKEPSSSPITVINRGPAVVKGGKTILPVTFLDARPQNDATTSVGTAPNDGFFTQANYRGAFEPATSSVVDWLAPWTASYAYGFTPNLFGDVTHVSVSQAGTQTMTLAAGASRAGNLYVIAGSLTATTPGIPVSGVVIPLFPDWYFFASFFTPAQFGLGNSAGLLDANGNATITFKSIYKIPQLAGIDVYHAGVVLNGSKVVTATNPVKVTFAP
jgi:hypothetical protein